LCRAEAAGSVAFATRSQQHGVNLNDEKQRQFVTIASCPIASYRDST
jgi:hypothetical protein